MRRHMVFLVAACPVVVFLTSMVLAQMATSLLVEVVVAPRTLNLQSAGTCVTAHAEVDYRIVNEDSVELLCEGQYLTPYLVKFDRCGELVAKFFDDEVKQAVAGEEREVELTLVGELVDGTRFSGSDVIRVIDRRRE